MSAPPTRPAPRFEQQIEIETPEQVAFSYTVAGVGSRAMAALIDHALITLAIVALWSVLALLARAAGGAAAQGAERSSGGWAVAVVILVAFAIQWGYFVLFEALWDGQTPGKRKMKLRVVQDGGYSVSFAASATRNLARIVDMQPGFFYAVGVASAALSRSGKRLGDMVAGTFVVQEQLVTLARPDTNARAREEAAPVVTAALTREEYELLERFLARRATLDADRRRAIAEQLAERFAPHFPDRNGQPLFLLMRLYEGEKAARERGVAARGATGAAREHNALVARSAARWSAFAAAIVEAQRRGLRSMPEREVSELAAQYREVATDLARLRTATRGRDDDALFYVSRLVGAGHNLLYRQRSLAMRTALHYLFATVPREIRRSAGYILLAALLFFAPVGITYHAVLRHPALAEEILGPGMVDRANEGVARAKQHERTYVPVKDFMRPVMASTIIANNIQVTYAVFAMGITAGLVTLMMLVFNGVSIGAGLGLYASKGIFAQIGEFVLPHSTFELSAICIAGGGGFLLAAALLVPGARTRREALVVNGRRAIRLMAACTMLLVCAGTIEGLVSPRTDLPLWVKFVVAGASATALIAYISLGGRGAVEGELHAEEFAYGEATASSAP
ncbi:MAG TPA: stage II sporulation protein M [Gemmatimonadaceae bacterium]|nr:stage II sporulation protein M [Gemmatimonadaceae bacterium]